MGWYGNAYGDCVVENHGNSGLYILLHYVQISTGHRPFLFSKMYMICTLASIALSGDHLLSI